MRSTLAHVKSLNPHTAPQEAWFQHHPSPGRKLRPQNQTTCPWSQKQTPAAPRSHDAWETSLLLPVVFNSVCCLSAQGPMYLFMYVPMYLFIYLSIHTSVIFLSSFSPSFLYSRNPIFFFFLKKKVPTDEQSCRD